VTGDRKKKIAPFLVSSASPAGKRGAGGQKQRKQPISIDFGSDSDSSDMQVDEELTYTEPKETVQSKIAGRGGAVKSARIKVKQTEQWVKTVGGPPTSDKKADRGDPTADVVADSHLDRFMFEISGESGDDSDYVITSGSDQEDDEYEETEPSREGKGRRVADAEQYAHHLNDIDDFAAKDFKSVDPDVDNPDFVHHEYVGHPPGLTDAWFGGGDPTPEQIFDPLWILFHFVTVGMFKKIAVRTDAEHSRTKQVFDETELSKQDEDSTCRRKKQRHWTPVADSWNVIVRWFGVIVWRSSTKRGRSDHANAFTKTGGHNDNAGNYDSRVHSTMSLLQWEGIKRYLCVCDEVEAAKSMRDTKRNYDCLSKVRPFMDHVRGNTEKHFCPNCYSSIDESTFMCGTYGPGCYCRRIKGKNVASNGFQNWVLVFKYEIRVHNSEAAARLLECTTVNLSVAHSWVPRLVAKKSTGNGGGPVCDPQRGVVANGITELLARVKEASPSRKWSTTVSQSPRVLFVK